MQEIHGQTVQQALLAAKSMGLQALFGHCATLKCRPSHPGASPATWWPLGRWGWVRRVNLEYVAVPMALTLPVHLELETTAVQEAHLLLGIASHSGLELQVNGLTGASRRPEIGRSRQVSISFLDGFGWSSVGFVSSFDSFRPCFPRFRASVGSAAPPAGP